MTLETLSSSSNLKLFADDCLLFRENNTIGCAEEVQKDRFSHEKWTEDWHNMRFHPLKCYVMKIATKREPILHNNPLMREKLKHNQKVSLISVSVSTTN